MGKVVPLSVKITLEARARSISSPLLTCAVADRSAAKVSLGAEAVVVARVSAAGARGRRVAARRRRVRRRRQRGGRARAQVPAGRRRLVQVLPGREVCGRTDTAMMCELCFVAHGLRAQIRF